MIKSDVTKLIELYMQISKCSECKLPENYRPQLRPPGPDYEKGGIVFVQINPGFIGSMVKKEIPIVYKTEKNRKIAEKKIIRTKEILKAQAAFIQSHSIESYSHFVKLIHSHRDEWGWPEGKFKKTIEEHGVELKNVAIINLAQCPVENNKFGKILKPCIDKWFFEMLDCLQPVAIVAQGKVVYNFLNTMVLPQGLKPIEGVHHAFRGSNKHKQEVLKQAISRIKQLS